MSSQSRLAELCQAFDEAAGIMPKVLIRRVWLGPPLTDLVAQQRRFYQPHQREQRAQLAEDQTISTADPKEMADLLADLLRSTGADALNLRVHLPGIPPEAIREQIAGLAADVLPRLRRSITSRPEAGAR
jgi:hypothetical protein